MNTADTVTVRLTAAGIAEAKGGKISVHGLASDVSFQGDSEEVVHLTTWTGLKGYQIAGQPLFEIVPASAAQAAPASVSFVRPPQPVTIVATAPHPAPAPVSATPEPTKVAAPTATATPASK